VKWSLFELIHRQDEISSCVTTLVVRIRHDSWFAMKQTILRDLLASKRSRRAFVFPLLTMSHMSALLAGLPGVGVGPPGVTSGAEYFAPAVPIPV